MYNKNSRPPTWLDKRRLLTEFRTDAYSSAKSKAMRLFPQLKRIISGEDYRNLVKYYLLHTNGHGSVEMNQLLDRLCADQEKASDLD